MPIYTNTFQLTLTLGHTHKNTHTHTQKHTHTHIIHLVALMEDCSLPEGSLFLGFDTSTQYVSFSSASLRVTPSVLNHTCTLVFFHCVASYMHVIFIFGYNEMFLIEKKKGLLQFQYHLKISRHAFYITLKFSSCFFLLIEHKE